MKFKKKRMTVEALFNDDPREIMLWQLTTMRKAYPDSSARVYGKRVLIKINEYQHIEVPHKNWLVIDGNKFEVYTEESFYEHFERFYE